jgi:hypothetical protein
MSSSGSVDIVSVDMRACDPGRSAVTQIGLDDYWIGNHLRRTALRDNAALGQHEHMLGEAHHRLHHVFDHQHGDAPRRKRADHRHDVANFRRVEPGKDLVEQKKLRLGRERAG